MSTLKQTKPFPIKKQYMYVCDNLIVHGSKVILIYSSETIIMATN